MAEVGRAVESAWHSEKSIETMEMDSAALAWCCRLAMDVLKLRTSSRLTVAVTTSTSDRANCCPCTQRADHCWSPGDMHAGELVQELAHVMADDSPWASEVIYLQAELCKPGKLCVGLASECSTSAS